MVVVLIGNTNPGLSRRVVWYVGPKEQSEAEEEDGDGDGDGDRDLVLGEEKPSPVPSLPSSKNVECKRSNLYRMKDMIIEIFMWRDAAKSISGLDVHVERGTVELE
ncbi:hypothetical protein V6N13_082096 [Hibiscus sabdariffa]|uniref:Uncharacterized protein n=1 Tax=Hibiscus sabdariffa TaxID=183260 RepID=A0ABR2ATG8_9ROSI